MQDDPDNNFYADLDKRGGTDEVPECPCGGYLPGLGCGRFNNIKGLINYFNHMKGKPEGTGTIGDYAGKWLGIPLFFSYSGHSWNSDDIKNIQNAATSGKGCDMSYPNWQCPYASYFFAGFPPY
jgi:hypothetical protein